MKTKDMRCNPCRTMWFSAGAIGVQRPPVSSTGPLASCSSRGRQQPIPTSVESRVQFCLVPSSDSEYV